MNFVEYHTGPRPFECVSQSTPKDKNIPRENYEVIYKEWQNVLPGHTG